MRRQKRHEMGEKIVILHNIYHKSCCILTLNEWKLVRVFCFLRLWKDDFLLCVELVVQSNSIVDR